MDVYRNNLKNREFDKEGALNLSQAQPAPKQLNLNKLSDAGGSQIEWLPTPSKTAFSGTKIAFTRIPDKEEFLEWQNKMLLEARATDLL